MLSGVDRHSGERLDDVNIRYQMNTFLIAGHETTSGMLSFAIYFLLNNPHVLQKAYEEVDRVLGRDINAKPTAQQVNQLVYIGQILKESLRLWPTAPAFGLYPYQNETIGGKYKLRKRTFVTVLTAMLHRDQSVWGPARGSVRSRELRARSRGQDAAARLQAVRQRPARLHRPAVRHDRGDPGAGPDPAALPPDRSHALPAQDQGIAHHQARRPDDAREAAGPTSCADRA